MMFELKILSIFSYAAGYLSIHPSLYVPPFITVCIEQAEVSSVTFPLEELGTPSHGMMCVTLPALFCHICFPSSLTWRSFSLQVAETNHG
jgi:hypothetical protein